MIWETSRNKLKKHSFQKLFWPFTVQINCPSDLKIFVSKFFSIKKTFFSHSRSEQFWKQNTMLIFFPCVLFTLLVWRLLPNNLHVNSTITTFVTHGELFFHSFPQQKGLLYFSLAGHSMLVCTVSSTRNRLNLNW